MAAIRLLTFSTLFPHAARPNHGIFVENRLRHLLASGQATSTVLAPVPWFPSRSDRFGDWALNARAPASETRHGIAISHPRYPVIPKIGMLAAPWLLYRAMVPQVARQLAVSPRQLTQVLKERTGRTFADLLREARIERACELLAETDRTVAAIAVDVGFCDQSYFTHVFQKIKKTTPKQYRDATAGQPASPLLMDLKMAKPLPRKDQPSGRSARSPKIRARTQDRRAAVV